MAPTIPPAPDIPAPPRPTADDETIVKGNLAYDQICAQCHGRNAISTNTMPDLRHMSPQTHQEFNDIVLKGTGTTKGMASFADVLTQDRRKPFMRT